MKFKISEGDIAGVVILYDSPTETLGNIATYIDQVEKLYVVDNSIHLNKELNSLVQIYPHVYYHSMGGNKGIAAGLNWAANQAIIDGFTVLLTMDDDTKTPDLMVSLMIAFWNDYSEPIGILSGVHNTNPDMIPSGSSMLSYRTLPYTLTSGNMLSLIAYKAIGGFWDELFIDHVDHEYGLRLNINGYKVVELKNIYLDHNLGYRQEVKFGSFVVRKYGTHSPTRLYYFTRNGIYVARLYFRLYPSFSWMVLKELLKRIIKAAFLDADRGTRFSMLLQGARDGWQGKMGKYSK